VATGIYRFTFTSEKDSDIAVDWSNDGGSTFRSIQGNNHLKLNASDHFQVALRGPLNWTMSETLELIVARSGRASAGQNYTPFHEVRFEYPVGDMTTSSEGSLTTRTSPSMGPIPSTAKGHRYEVIIAFTATMNGVRQFFSFDPEMEISTT
jgi:hypothetical protein